MSEWERLDDKRNQLETYRRQIDTLTIDIVHAMDLLLEKLRNMAGEFNVALSESRIKEALKQEIDDAVSPLRAKLRSMIDSIDERMHMIEQREIMRDYRRGLL